MEIQKIFTDTEGNERLYSVLLSEEELKLFSEIQKEFNSKAQKALRSFYDMKVGGKTLKKGFEEGIFNKRDFGKFTFDDAKRWGRNNTRFMFNKVRNKNHNASNIDTLISIKPLEAPRDDIKELQNRILLNRLRKTKK